MAAPQPAGPSPPSALTEKDSPKPTPQARRYVLSRERSRIRIVAGSILGDHPVTVERFSGSASVVEEDLAKSKLSVEIDTDSVSASSQTLTRILKSPRVLDVERFPQATFVLQSIRRSQNAANSYVLQGELTLHGVTRTIEVDARVSRILGAFVARSQFSIRRQDFDIEPGGLLGLLLHDEVKVNLELVATPVGRH